MYVRSISALAAGLCVAAEVSAAHATAPAADAPILATLSNVNGEVLVNRGQGFRPAAPGMALRPGDRILVTARGRARLSYTGGCGVSLGAGSMATVTKLAPCKVGLRQARILAIAQNDSTAPPPPGAAATTPFGLSPGVLSLLTVGVFTLGAAGVSGAFESSSP